MAYQGATAASSVANPPLLMASAIANAISAFFPVSNAAASAYSTGMNMGSTQIGSTLYSMPGRAFGGQLWYYASTDPSTTVGALGYFTDGQKLGMRPGDILHFVYQSSQGSSVVLSVGVISDVTSTGASVGVNGSTGSWLSSTR
jgi:hypothetical protein